MQASQVKKRVSKGELTSGWSRNCPCDFHVFFMQQRHEDSIQQLNFSLPVQIRLWQTLPQLQKTQKRGSCCSSSGLQAAFPGVPFTLTFALTFIWSPWQAGEYPVPP
jgi:hypothetical protein